jgi:hypothetical protein
MIAVASSAAVRGARGRCVHIGSADLWRHELGRARSGLASVGLFAAGWACYLIILALRNPHMRGWHGLRQPAWGTLQEFLPVVCGLGVAGLMGAAQTFELHLALPTSLRLTLVRRLALVLGAALALGLAVWVATFPAGLRHEGAAETLLQLLGPLILLCGAGALAAAASGSSRAAAGAVVLLWIGNQVWVQSDRVLLAAGVIALLAAWLALGRNEHLMRVTAA